MAVPAGVGLSAFALVASGMVLGLSHAGASSTPPRNLCVETETIASDGEVSIVIPESGHVFQSVWPGVPNAVRVLSSTRSTFEVQYDLSGQSGSRVQQIVELADGYLAASGVSSQYLWRVPSSPIPSPFNISDRGPVAVTIADLVSSGNSVYFHNTAAKVTAYSFDSSQSVNATLTSEIIQDLAVSPVDGKIFVLTQDKLFKLATDLSQEASVPLGDKTGDLVTVGSDGTVIVSFDGDKYLGSAPSDLSSFDDEWADFTGLSVTIRGLTAGKDQDAYLVTQNGVSQVDYSSGTPNETLNWVTASGACSSPRQITTDSAGNVWTVSEGSIAAYGAGVPTAPTFVGGSSADASVDLSWSAPAATGASALTQYAIQYSSDDGASWSSSTTVSGATASKTITGLNNGTSYVFRVRATNNQGDSQWSVVSDGVTPVAITAPNAPTGLSATAQDGAATIAFTAPTDDGGSPIVNYQYRLNDGAWESLDPADASSPIAITGLTNGVEYTVAIRADNGTLTGTASSTVDVTPLGTPGAPTGLSATAQDQAASISFTAGSDGGSPILDYEYQLDGGEWESAGTTSSPVVIEDLSNGTTYSVKLRATNAIGDGKGTPSTAVNVTPVSSEDPPGIPTAVEALPGGTTLSLSWEAPTPGGAPISDYEYKTDSDAWLSLNTTGTSAVISTNSAGVNLDPATEYVIQVRAKNVNGPGDPSNSVSQIPGVPLAPQNPSSEWDADSLTLTWPAAVANGDPISEYRLVVSKVSGRSGVLMARSGPGTYTTSSTSYTVPGLDPASSYSITLSARNGRGWGLSTTLSIQGTGIPETVNQTPPAIIQQVGMPPSGSCDDVVGTRFGSQTSIQGGWGQSWAQWMNNGLGGAVCTRTLVYSSLHSRWVLAE